MNAVAAEGARPVSVVAFALSALGTFLVSMDVTITLALQPPIARAMHGASAAAVSWTVTAYAITFAAALVPAGRIADRRGRRVTFMDGLLIFGGGSLLCAAAPDLPLLIAGRVLQGIGAATLQPASLGLLLAVTPALERSHHAARWAAASGVGVAIGPVVGGAITDLTSWRWAFLVNVPIVLVALRLTPRTLTETERHPGRALPDPVGAFVLAAAAAALTLAITQVTTWGLLAVRTGLCVVAGILLGTAFVERCRRVSDPLLRLGLLRDRRFAFVTATTIFYAAGFFGFLYSAILFLIGRWRLPTIDAGLAIVPVAFAVCAMAPRVGGISARRGFGLPLAGGAVTIAAGLLLNVLLENGSAFDPTWGVTALIIGTGIGLCYLLLGAAAVHEMPSTELAAATALNQCARQLGAALGVATMVAALKEGERASLTHFHLAWFWCAGFCVLAGLTASQLGLRDRTGIDYRAVWSGLKHLRP
jgi:EmrB/QacA subfamily drug resistance transporter